MPNALIISNDASTRERWTRLCASKRIAVVAGEQIVGPDGGCDKTFFGDGPFNVAFLTRRPREARSRRRSPRLRSRTPPLESFSFAVVPTTLTRGSPPLASPSSRERGLKKRSAKRCASSREARRRKRRAARNSNRRAVADV